MPGQNYAFALEKFTSFGDLLKFLRRRAGLTQRELSIAVGYSHAQISRLELNQRVPDPATVAARFIPALELQDEPQVARRLLELAAMPGEEAPAAGLPPYKGLQYFSEADAELFFGREALVARLVPRIEAALSAAPALRFLAVVGASGSGKSSILRAGLIPALRRRSASKGWMIQSLTPTARPLQALATSLTQGIAPISATAALMDDLASDRRVVHLMAAQLLNTGNGYPAPARSRAPEYLLLVIDQFEELFTLCRDESERRAFVDNLITAAAEPGGTTFVIIALRADFYSHCAPYAALRDALASQQEYIGPMSADELRRAIEQPAKRGNWELEPGLVELLMQDVGADGEQSAEPGALPLLSHALLETWHRRNGRSLTVSGYLASGGVRGAIAETADIVFNDELDAEQRVIARNLFLRLTQFGEDDATPETRRRAIFQELIHKKEDEPAVREVVTHLADARLITTDNGIVEVAHEALIHEWPTLRGWLEEDREGLRLHRHLTLAAEGWERQSHDPGDLYRGARLEQAAGWAEAHQEALSELEQAFLVASQAQAGQEEAEREAQRQRELKAAQALAETERRAAVQLRRRALYLFGAFILALILGGVALFQGEVARQSAVTAQNERRIAYGRELAAAADNNLEIDPERGILLALQAISTTRTVNGTVLPEAVEALHRAIVSSQVRYTLTGHNDRVVSTDFSPDGKHLATIGQDGTAIVWDTTNGKELLRLPGTTPYNDAIGNQRVAYSPDGTRLATGDSTFVKVWDASSGALLMTLTGHEGEVWAVAFSPDGKELASGDADGTLRLWDVATGEARHVITGHQSAIEGLAFSPDGKQVATGSDDQTLKVWDTENGTLLTDLKDFSEPVYSVDFSPDGKKLVTIGDRMKIWDAHALEKGPILTFKENPFNARFSPDGTWLAAGNGSAAIIWDVETGRKLLTLAGHHGWVVSISFSPDGKRLATASYDGTAKIWNILPGQEEVTLSGKGQRVAYSPDGTKLATEGSDGNAQLWDAATGEKLLTLSGHESSLLGIAFSPDGKRLATASIDKTAKVWDTTTGQLYLTLKGHDIGVRDVAFSPDGTRIATAGFDRTTRIWDAYTGQELLKLTGHDGLVLGVAFSPDGTRLATSSTDKTAKIWDAKTGQMLFNLEGHGEPIPDIAFSPDGSRVATGSGDGTAKIWDAATGKELLTLIGHSAEIQSVTFSPDGKLLATGSGDSTAIIWDVSTGKELLTLPGLSGVTGVAFSPQDGGGHLAVASSEGFVRVYLLKIEDVIALAKERLTRTLTLGECQKYLHLEQCPAN